MDNYRPLPPAELAAWYRTRTSDAQPILLPAPQTIDDDWQIGWE